jgi:hypothetical protein
MGMSLTGPKLKVSQHQIMLFEYTVSSLWGKSPAKVSPSAFPPFLRT